MAREDRARPLSSAARGSGPSPGSPALGVPLEGWKEPRIPEGARESQPRGETPPGPGNPRLLGHAGARGSRMRAGRVGKARGRRLGADAEGATGSSRRSLGAALAFSEKGGDGETRVKHAVVGSDICRRRQHLLVGKAPRGRLPGVERRLSHLRQRAAGSETPLPRFT